MYKYGSLTFGPEAGGVLIIDEDPSTPERHRMQVSLPKFLERIVAQQQYLLAAKRDQHVGNMQQVMMKAQHVAAINGLVEAMCDVYNRAQKQGDLTRASVQEYYKRHVATVRQTYAVPSLISSDMLPD